MAESKAPVGSRPPPDHPEHGIRYPSFVLFVLMLVYVLNFVDRNILSILAEEIKADLDLTDAQLGFLYGTAFAVFYAVFGVPLGRLADIWIRKKLIAICLVFWSIMTALSGTAQSLLGLGVYRVGIGIGEAGASPAAYSLLCDYFPPRMRATALSIYSSGIFIGSGISVLLGGWVIDLWKAAFPAGNAPLGLAAWQAAFFVVSLPGILLAVWVWRLREPDRGRQEGLGESAVHPAPIREFAREVAVVIPPLTVWSLVRSGAGPRTLCINAAAAAFLAAGAWLMVGYLGDPAQWVSLAIGLYAFCSWMQRLNLRDPSAFRSIFGSRPLVLSVIAYSWISFVGWGFLFWMVPYALRTFDVSPGVVGTFLGLAGAVGGWIGVNAGGFVSDWLVPRTRWARVLMGIAVTVLAPPLAIAMLSTANLYFVTGMFLVFKVVSSLWIGSGSASVNELVPPHVRGTASAFYLLCLTFIGLALGPYTAGKISDGFVAAGIGGSEALRSSLMILLCGYAPALVCLVLAGRGIGNGAGAESRSEVSTSIDPQLR